MTVLVVGGIFREIHDGDTVPRPSLGGSGLTAAIIASRLGAQTRLASYVGEEDREAVGAMLGSAGVDDGGLEAVPGASATFVFPTVEDSAHPWPMYRPAENVPVDRTPVPTADVVLVFGIPDLDAIEAGWLDLERDAVLIWDRQGWISRARDCRRAAELAPMTKLYVANLEEAREEFPGGTIEETLQQLPPPGFTAALVKRGEEGCLVIQEEPVDVPGFPVRVHSSIGSGDAFGGALAAGLDAGLPLVVAARKANAAAAAYLEARGDPLADLIPQRTDDLAGEA